MKQYLILLVAGVAILCSCNKESIKGAGNIITESRNLPPFKNVELAGSGDVTIHYGATQNVTVSGYQNLLPVYETRVTANTLHLQFQSGIFNVRNNNIRVDIELPDLAQMRINGAGQFVAANFINGDKMTAFINGSGNILINDSKYNKTEYTVNGTGEIMAATTSAAEAQAQIVGSGKISMKVSNKLVANISGSGIISFWGNPASVETQVSGSGKIIKK